MSAAGIKIATTTTPNTHTVAAADECDVRIKTTTNSEADCALNLKIGAENSSFSTLNSLKEQLTSSCSSNELQQNKVPLENSQLNNRQLRENEAEKNLPTAAAAPNRDLSSEFPNNHLQQGDVDNTSATQLSPGLSLLQQTAAASSPPPHSYRHSRAYRHFKNPPQPHMCIRTTTEAGEELFINVLSWTRIVIPQEPSDPIPLYGGMRVPPGSPRSPPIVFAVMANPEVLKDSGRHSKDPEERRAMVELMCDFVEAMNPGVKLVRNAVILKDRDISGELKDVWNAVQAQRDREREEQMLLQRQQHQQHFHNLTNASTNGSLNANTSLTTANNSANATATSQQMFPKSVHSGAAGEAMLMAVDGGTPPRSRKIIHEVQNDNVSNTDVELDIDMQKANNSQLSLALLAEHLDNKMSLVVDGEQGEENQQTQQQNNQNTLTNDALSNGNNSKDSLVQERGNKMDINNQLNAINCNKDSKQQQQQQQQPALSNGTAANCNDMEVTNVTKTIIATSTPPNATISAIPAQNSSTTTTAGPTPIPAPTPQAPTKKEKLGGFLPNGCIFPRFTKNNKNKDKDKDKEKETKTKDKEKNVLLSALKKSKDKKTTAAAAAALAANQDEKITSTNSNTTAATTPNCTQTNNKQKQNCLQQLECGVQKLDLNNHHHNPVHTNDNNINNTANTTITNNTSATNKSNSTTTSSTSGVGVH